MTGSLKIVANSVLSSLNEVNLRWRQIILLLERSCGTWTAIVSNTVRTGASLPCVLTSVKSLFVFELELWFVVPLSIHVWVVELTSLSKWSFNESIVVGLSMSFHELRCVLSLITQKDLILLILLLISVMHPTVLRISDRNICKVPCDWIKSCD